MPPEVSKHLHDFSRLVLHPATLEHTIDGDTDLPTIHPLTTFGEENKTKPLRTSEGWRALKRIQTHAGVVGFGYPQLTLQQDFNRRVHQYATLHLWHGTSAVATCPMAMTDGAAVLLRRHLEDPDDDQPGRGAVFRESYNRLVSLDPAHSWTSGQWMTERTGGSDVRGTETVARRMTEKELSADGENGRDKDAHGLSLGPWVIDGFKWFSSATDADVAVLLAQTNRGLSAFYAPLRRRIGHSPDTPVATAAGLMSDSRTGMPTEMNGVRIQRLKSKLGTRGVPTAELELKGTRGYLIGQEGQGIKEISSILNITRLHTASAGAGYLARGLAVSRAYTKARKVRDQLLCDNPQHLAWMAGESVKYRAHTHLVFLGVALLGASEQGSAAATRGTHAGTTLIPQDKSTVDKLLRLLTPVMKAQVTLNSVTGLRACMESLGGVGYCENNEDGGVLNISRLFRDSVVGTIWEGTTAVMAEDVLRVVKNPKAKAKPDDDGADVVDAVLGPWVRGVLTAVATTFPRECELVWNRYTVLKKTVQTKDLPTLQRHGRVLLEHIEAVVCACLLMYDACADGDDIATAVAKRWVLLTALPTDRERALVDRDSPGPPAEDDIDMDRRIFLGSGAGHPTVPGRLTKL